MSTEATGDGRADAVGAGGPNVTAEGTNPTATAAAGQEADRQDADGAPADLGGPGQADAAQDEPPAANEAAGTGEAAACGEDDQLGDLSGCVAVSEPGGVDEADELTAGGEGFEYGDAEYGDAEYGDDAEYDEYGPEDAAGPRRSRRWSKALLALGFMVLAAVIVGGAIAIVGSVTHGFKKPVKVTYKKSALFSLKTGECFDPQGQSYSLVPCGSPHDAEVFATFTLRGSKWPGAAAVAGAASSGCASRLTRYLNPQLAISLSSTYVYPDSVAWRAGTKTVICEVRATSGQLTGSVRKASTTAG